MLELENYVKGEFEDYYQTCGRCHKFIQSVRSRLFVTLLELTIISGRCLHIWRL